MQIAYWQAGVASTREGHVTFWLHFNHDVTKISIFQ